MRGYLFALLAITVTALQVVSARYALLEWEVNTLVFVLVALLTSAWVQLAAAWYNSGSWLIDSLRQFHTWLYALMHITLSLLGFYTLYFITTTEAFFLQRFSILAAIPLALVFLGRMPHISDLPWALVIMAGLGVIVSSLDPSVIPIVVMLVTINGFLNAGRTMLTEAHPTYLRAGSIWDRMRVTGTIIYITSLLLLLVFFGLATVKGSAGIAPAIPGFPEVRDFFHEPTLIAGVLLGFLLIPLDTYANFRAASLLNSERLLMAKALMPFAVLLIETPFSLLSPIMSISDVSVLDIVAGAVIAVAGVAMLLNRKHLSAAIVTPVETMSAVDVDPKQAMNDLSVIQHTVEYHDGDTEKAAKVLGLERAAIETVLSSETWMLTPESSRRLHNRFAKNVAFLDGLTGLSNKVHFMSLLREAMAGHSKVSVLYLDLDGFKPINDTYGHDIGDETLRIVALRLASLAKQHKAMAARLAGDEFALLVTDAGETAIKKLQLAIADKLSQPIRIDGLEDKPTLGVSVGLAHYPKDAREAHQLLSVADGQMYRAKRAGKRQRRSEPA